jgi:hypothetical protein
MSARGRQKDYLESTLDYTWVISCHQSGRE